MKKKDLQHLEKRLLQLRDRALKDLGHYDESFSPDGAVYVFQRTALYWNLAHFGLLQWGV